MPRKSLKEILKDIEHDVEMIGKREEISEYGFFKSKKE
jgi:hypothetical protein